MSENFTPTGRPPRRRRSVIASIAAIIAVVAASIVLLPTAGGAYGGFSDVDETEYYADAIAWMAAEDLSTGTSPGCFSPDSAVTRGQAATFLYRLAGSPSAPSSHPFTDVNAAYQQDPIAWLSAEGYTTGVSPTQFAPDRSLTRGEFAAFLYRFEETGFSGAHPFIDVTAEYQQDSVAWLYANDITTGVSEIFFAPNRTISRAEVATMLWRYAGEPSVSVPADVQCSGQSSGGSGGSSGTGSGSGSGSGGGSGGRSGGGSTPPPAPNGPFVKPSQIGSSVGAGADAAMPTTTVGDRELHTNGAVLQNVIVNGCIHVEADNVTISNVIVNCDNTYPIRVENSDNLRVEYSRIDCGNTSQKGFFISDSSDFVINRIEVTGCDDQMFIEAGLGNSQVSNSVFHNQAPGTDSHTDGIQLGTFDTTTGTLRVVGNWWEYNRSGCCENAVMFLSGQSAITARVLNNYLDGDFGTHILRCHNTSRCIVENNTVPYEPDGFVVHDTSSRAGIARCNRYASGSLIPNDLFNGIEVDNSSC